MNTSNINEIKLKIMTELGKIEKAKSVVNKMREENYDAAKIEAHLNKINERERNLLNQQREIEEFEIREMKRVQEERFKSINEDLMIQKTQREKEVLDLTSQVENSRFTLDKLRQEKDSLATEISTMSEKKKKIEDEYQSFQIKYENDRKNSHETQIRLDSAKQSIEKDIFDLESKKNSLESSISIKKHDLLELRDEILSEERKLSELKATNKSSMENELSSLFSEDTVALETNSLSINTSDLFANSAISSSNNDNLEKEPDLQLESSDVETMQKDEEVTLPEVMEIKEDLANEDLAKEDLANEDLFADQTSVSSDLDEQVAAAVAEVEDKEESIINNEVEENEIDQLEKIEQESTKMLEMLKLSNTTEETENEKTAILSGADPDKLDNINAENLSADEDKAGIGFWIILILILIALGAAAWFFILPLF
jgi:hypothetical protein